MPVSAARGWQRGRCVRAQVHRAPVPCLGRRPRQQLRQGAPPQKRLSAAHGVLDISALCTLSSCSLHAFMGVTSALHGSHDNAPAS